MDMTMFHLCLLEFLLVMLIALSKQEKNELDIDIDVPFLFSLILV